MNPWIITSYLWPTQQTLSFSLLKYIWDMIELLFDEIWYCYTILGLLFFALLLFLSFNRFSLRITFFILCPTLWKSEPFILWSASSSWAIKAILTQNYLLEDIPPLSGEVKTTSNYKTGHHFHWLSSSFSF